MGTNGIEIRLARLEGSYEQIDRRLTAIESRLVGMESPFGDLDRKIDAVFFRLVTLMFGSWVTLMLAVLFAHK